MIVSCIYDRIFKISEKTKRENISTKCFYIYFYRVFYKDFINRDLVFSIFTTLYRIGNIAINTSQLCVFALDTQYFLGQVCVVSLLGFYQNLPLPLL